MTKARTTRRSIGVVTGGRSDYGILVPLLRRIQSDPTLELRLYVTAMHLAPEYGDTLATIAQDGFSIAERVDLQLTSTTPSAIARAISLGVSGFAAIFEHARPDLLVVLGDRFEVLAAATAAVPFVLPVAHIGGGEVTEGAIDDAMRHAVTKLSHLHLVSLAEYRDRILQMGEEPWRVHVTGALGLDNLRATKLLSKETLASVAGMRLDSAPLLVTFHPETLDYAATLSHAEELLAALDAESRPLIFTAPNADTSGREIRLAIERFVAAHPNARLVLSLGTQAYFSLMKHAAAMVGNSSSGIIEAANFELPVVDIGARQGGRVHAGNVIHAAPTRAAIRAAIKQALAPKFRESLRGMRNPYGEGEAAPRILEILKTAELDGLTRKKFCNLAPAVAQAAEKR